MATVRRGAVDLSGLARVTYKPERSTVFGPSPTLASRLSVRSGTGGPDDPYVVDVTVVNLGAAAWTGVVQVSLWCARDDARFFLPGFLYGRNSGDSRLQPGLIKEFPRLRPGEIDLPFAPSWHVRADQLTHPVAAMVAAGRLWAVAGGPYLISRDPLVLWEGDARTTTPGRAGFAGYNGFSCSVDGGVGFTLGYADLPGIYVTPWEYVPHTPERQGCVTVPPGRSITFGVQVFTFLCPREDGVGRVLQHVYGRYHQRPVPRDDADLRTTVGRMTRAIARDAYDPEARTYGLVRLDPVSTDRPDLFALQSRFDPDRYTATWEGVIAWTNGAAIAAPLLRAAARLGDEDLRRQATAVIDAIVAGSRNPVTGIPFAARVDGVWTNRGWWTPWVESEGAVVGHPSYVVGHALFYVLQAYVTERSAGRDHRGWLEFVGDVIDAVRHTQDDDGAFPRFWDESTGHGSGHDAFAGCWVAAAMALYASLAGRCDLLAAARAAEVRYRRDVVRMECTGTPLDVADAPDSEGVLAYLRLTALLAGAAEEPDEAATYAACLRAGLDYAVSFVYCWNVPDPAEPLRSVGWSSSGGAVTSVCNAVLHAMTTSVLDELAAFCDLTGDPYYASRLADIHGWGLGIANHREAELGFGRAGWSPEYFCQAARHVLDVRLDEAGHPYSGLWFAFHPWGAAAVLEGLCGVLWPDGGGPRSAYRRLVDGG